MYQTKRSVALLESGDIQKWREIVVRRASRAHLFWITLFRESSCIEYDEKRLAPVRKYQTPKANSSTKHNKLRTVSLSSRDVAFC